VTAVTRDRSFKKVIRARMRRTGESYTAARAQLRRSPPPSRHANRGGAGMYPFERFTEQAKKALTLAQEEAEASRLVYIGAEHLLLGLVGDGEALACKALGALGVSPEQVRGAVAAAVQPGGEAPRRIIPTSRVKKVIEISFQEAQRLGHDHVGTDHLLFGLIIEGESVAARVLQDLGVTLDKAREEVDRLLQAGEGEAASVLPEPAPQGGARLPLSSELSALLLRARLEASSRGSSAVRLEDLLAAMMGPAAAAALERLLEVGRLQALRDQAIAAKEFEAATEHRADARRAAERLEQALALWRAELR
jgi:ATP-dependent Clp protease ATP-binding subunit ClpA